MIEWFLALNPVTQALLAGCFTWLVTALGAGMVFFFKEMNKRVLNAMLAFAAGVMIAASFWSLLSPAVRFRSGHRHSLDFCSVRLPCG
jgi:ZIP family zinc transporter